MSDTAAIAQEIQGERTLLIVEDDKTFLQRLASAMESRGFEVSTAESVSEGVRQADASPAYAVVDMRLGDGSGPRCHHRSQAPTSRLPRHSSYRLRQYRDGRERREDRRRRLHGETPWMLTMSSRHCWRRKIRRLRRRKIRCRRTACAGSTFSASMNCATATSPKPRAVLNMHRRTLQRILAKRAPRCIALAAH